MLTDVRGHENYLILNVDGFKWLEDTPMTNVLESSFDEHLYMQEMSQFL